MSKNTLTGRSQQVPIRIPLDMLEWLRLEAGQYRSLSGVIKEKLRESYLKSEAYKKVIIKAQNARKT